MPDTTPTNAEQTAETYLGSSTCRVANTSTGALGNGTKAYSYPGDVPDDAFALTGIWTVAGQSITSGNGAASDVYLDVGGTGPSPQDISRGIASGWAWASGGIVSTPADFNTFIRAYVSGRLISNKTRMAWLQPFLPDIASDPNGPGFNSAGLSLFRYDARCGTVYGHAGNIFGYTQFAVSTLDGSRSAAVSINLQRTQDNEGQPVRVFAGLTQVVQAAVCRALA